MLSILASFAQEESRSISENVKWGIHKRFKNGEIGAANKHILGYRYDDELKKYVIIPEEAEAVRWMFQMYIDGVTLRDIADSMNNAGIRTTLGNDFQEASVRQLIFNEVYAGDIRRQKCYIEDPITKRKVPNRGELPQYYMADSHEAIIDRDTYAKVKAEMERRASLLNPTFNRHFVPPSGSVVQGNHRLGKTMTSISALMVDLLAGLWEYVPCRHLYLLPSR